MGDVIEPKKEQKDRLLIMIFLVIMIIQFTINFLNYSQMFLPFGLCKYIISLIIFIINPVSVLIVFYKLGKKLDLISNLKTVIIRLLIGAYLGHFFSITILSLIEINYLIEGSNFYWLIYLSRILSIPFIGFFFASFTALAIA